MKKTFWHQMILLIAVLGFAESATAVPAPRKITTAVQPDGTVLNIWLKGDEFFHYALSTDGYVLMPDNNGFYTYAVQDSTGKLKAGGRVAMDEIKRSASDKLFLKNIKPGMSFSDTQLSNAIRKRAQNAAAVKSMLRSASTIAPGLISDYPTIGSPKSLVILANFSDSAFKIANTATVFSNMLNQEGYKDDLHVGSSRDYYKYNSNGVFTPEFVVVGPVTLPKTLAYYGQNDSDDNDTHPAQMVYDACMLAAASVDFSNFDYDNDGYVDNVYVFYAGKGEADGGGANTIWPHSWALSGEGLTLKLNGKNIQAYACSAELSGSGARTGIGTFTHEYGHILGLTDMYDVDYDSYNGEGFDIGEWSLMAYGSYNGNGCVPPCLTLLERKLLGWATPSELSYSASVNLPDLGSTNQGFIINTNNSGEYFLLENRQQTGNPWDAYLPYHGMLIYHIDMRDDVTTSINYYGTTKTWTYANLWSNNMVNAIANHQCADIEEADNSRSSVSTNIKGDPFPGLTNIKSFTNETTPSMTTWSGMSLNKPITAVLENSGVISFDFMGGSNFTSPPVSLPAKDVRPFRFTADWTSVKNATGYYIDVYTQEIVLNDTVKTYISGYENLLVKDTFLVINVPKDLTTYFYRVRATNNFSTTPNSDVASIFTTDGTPVALPATDINNFGFTANWKAEDWAEGYYIDIYTMETTTEDSSSIKYIDGYENVYTTSNALTIIDLDDQTAYYYRVRSTTGTIDTKNSNVISLTTPKASAIQAYVKNRTIYLKGMDREASVRIFDPMGIVCYTSNTNTISVKKPGIYLIETTFDGERQIIKILVQ